MITQTKTDNQLIAEFMGGKQKSKALPTIAERMEEDEMWLPIHGIRMINLMEYRKSWDWLMPVVEKIETIDRGDSHGLFRLSFYGNSVCWNDLPPRIDGQTKIEAVYKAVIEFINWYNAN